MHNLGIDIIELDLNVDHGFDPALEHDYDFQCFDDIVEDELGYSVKESGNAKWKKLQKFPWRFERKTDKKKAWTNRKGFDELVKTGRFKFLGFDTNLATTQQKQQWKELSALLAKLAGPKPSPKATKPHPETRKVKTKNFPYIMDRISDNARFWMTKNAFDVLVKTKQFKFIKFDSSLATASQKTEWAKLAKLLGLLKTPAPKPLIPKAAGPLALPHPDTKWLKAPGFPWVMKRISDNKGIHAGKAGFDFLVKTKQYKFIRFDSSIATPTQKAQWAELSEALKKMVPPKPKLKPLPIPKRKRAPLRDKMFAPPKGMTKDIQEIKKMLKLAETQRLATHEHEEIQATKEFRRDVLNRLMRIAEVVLSDDHPIRRRIASMR
jgi:hypothetical protein